MIQIEDYWIGLTTSSFTLAPATVNLQIEVHKNEAKKRKQAMKAYG